jgi:hypothetical protein
MKYLTSCTLIVLAVATIGPSAIASDAEAREFQILVDGRPAGSYTMTITKRPDGSVVQTGQANVRVRVLIKTFVYTYSGTETWHDDRLTKVESTTNDDGTRYQLKGTATEQGMTVTVNGRTSITSADTWTTSYWRLPAMKIRNGPIDLLDADNGRQLKVRLNEIGKTTIYVNGQPLEARHFQVRGAVSADLWHDANDRLVRLESIEDGHRTRLELIRIRELTATP